MAMMRLKPEALDFKKETNVMAIKACMANTNKCVSRIQWVLTLSLIITIRETSTRI